MFRVAILPAALACAALSALASANQEEVKSPVVLPHQLDVETTDTPAPADDARRNALSLQVATTSTPASEVGHHAPPPLPFPLYDVDEHGTVWVRGATYKASFGDGVATYVPFLGSHAPRNFPIEMRVSSVTCGGVDVAFDAHAAASRDGELVSLDRGSFVEQYVIAANGFEQRFVFSALPSRGEIVVSIDVASELAERSDVDGFRFENELGHVRYGRAFALDAHGARVSMDSRLVAGRIELVVPQSFAAAAVLPLVIDPFVGTIAVDVDAGSDWQADVAFDATTNNFGVVYENIFSDTDHDVYLRTFDDQILQGTATVDVSTVDWRNPKVANNNIANQFLCVAQAGVAGTRIIRGRTVQSSSLNTGAQFTISGSEAGDKLNPDVGGDPATTSPTFYCVVWQRIDSTDDRDIHARLVLTNSTLFGDSTMFLANSTITDELPSISKTNGLPPFSTQNWHVVWQHQTASDNVDIQGARILWDGSITNGPFFIASTVENERAPVASECLNDSAAGRPWIALFTIGSDLRMRVLQGTGIQVTHDFVATPLQNYGQPVVTTDGRKWTCAYSSSFGVFPNFDVDLNVASINWIDGSISFAESAVIASSSTLDETRPEIASTFTSTLTNPWRNYVTYDVYDETDYDVHFAVYDAPPNAGGFSYCYGTAAACPCGNGGGPSSGCANSVNSSGAQLDATGTWFVSGDSMQLQSTGMPPTATCLFFQGTSVILNGSPFGDGLRCVSGTTIRLGIKTASGGTATYGYPLDVPIHVRGMVPATGGYRYYQCWYRNSATFCTSSTFNLTNGFAALWAP